ncbi:arginine--tRNA ligase [Sorangium sp. So ce426]|uniref:arginine--tRNA ligase n=1 Tax=Sorangium sp. So ce426 TaxID=3133312 RepID=UPI003F5C9649
MADPVHALARALQAAITAAFGAEHAAVDPSLRRSTHADYQANAAMALGKRLGKPPREVAAAIVAALELDGICRKVEIAGPGFVNLTLEDAYLTRELAETAGGGRLGIAPAAEPETVIVDYSGPNAAKEMHVGHLRSTIIGDALARVLEALGHRVIRQNHLGDWGTPFGMLIEHMLDLGEAAASQELSVGDLNEFYRQARAKFDGDAAFAERSRRRVVRLQGGDEQTLALWRQLVRESKRYFESVYRRLGVTLTDADFAGESFYNPMLPDVVEELGQKGLARESEGALCVFPAGFTGKGGEPLPLIVRKQDGGYGYATTDLAAIRHRLTTVGARRIVYVVGAPQSQHFAMVFATAREAGWLAPPARAEHVAFGSVLGADKKMFKTRSGDTVKLSDLIDEAVERAAKVVREKNPELDAEAAGAVARAVGVGAVKYADLSSDRVMDYVFDWDRMLALKGNTAPYLMYAHARVRSIFRKAGVKAPAGDGILLGEPAERALALELLRFGAVVEDVAQTLQPHQLCGYLYGLADTFTTFYERCPVLKAESDDVRRSRLALCDLTAEVLAKGLGLLGIEAPERM